MNLESVGGPGQISPVESVTRSAMASAEVSTRARSSDAPSSSALGILGDLSTYVAAVQNQQTAPSDRVELLKVALLRGEYGAMLERLAEKLAGIGGG